MRRINALMIVAAFALVAASCGKDGRPLGSVPPSAPPSTTETSAPSQTTTTSAPSQTTTTSTSPSTTTSTPSTISTSPDAAAVAAALSGGWDAAVLRSSDTGRPGKIADTGRFQIITGSSFSGCCFEYGDLFVLQNDGTWADVTDPVMMPLDPLPPGAQPFIGDGPSDITVIDGSFVAPGATIFDPGTGDQPIASPRIWSGSDGTSWISQQITGEGTVTSVVDTSDGQIAIIEDGSGANSLWRSPAGQTWAIDTSVDIATAESNSSGDFSLGATDRVDRVGEVIVISSDVGPALLVSHDDGLTWNSPDTTMSAGNFVVTNGGALVLAPNQIWHTSNGFDWAPIGASPTPLMTASGINIDPFGLVAIDIGDATVLWPGGDPYGPSAGRFWVADKASEWIEVLVDPVFEPVAEGPVFITDMIVGSDGAVEAIGTVPVPFEGNKPLNDYMIWTHPAVTSNQ